MTLQSEVLSLLAIIPNGKVVTYGQIAKILGRPKASRVVGNILHRNLEPDRFPCYKVVNATGKLSSHYAYGGLTAQAKRLRHDGIIVQGDRVDLKRYQAPSDELANLLDSSINK